MLAWRDPAAPSLILRGRAQGLPNSVADWLGRPDHRRHLPCNYPERVHHLPQVEALYSAKAQGLIAAVYALPAIVEFRQKEARRKVKGQGCNH